MESLRNENCEPNLTDPSSGCDSVTCRLVSSSTASFTPPICGNGRREGFEECDQGGANGGAQSVCNASCKRTSGFCGDGIVETLLGEDCEPALIAEDAPMLCNGSCRLTFRRDLMTGSASSESLTAANVACTGSECADGGNDFCGAQDATCVADGNLPCIACVPRDSALPLFAPSDLSYLQMFNAAAQASASSAKGPLFVAKANCGNGVLNAGEQCDQGPENSPADNAFCRPDCSFGRCGDGVTDSSLERCDEGSQNGKPGSLCTVTCLVAAQDGTSVLPAAVIELPFSQRPFFDAMGNVQKNAQQNGTAINGTTASVVGSAQLPPTTASSGPETLAIMALGASAGYAWMKKKRVKEQ